jgi:MFS transporter, OPA family, glycerol-3-phosphate transporter
MPEYSGTGGESNRLERYRWPVFGVTWLTYVSYYFTRQSFSVAKVVFADSTQNTGVQLSRQEFGQIESWYQAAYACGQFVWGPLGDRLGARRVLICGMLLSIAAAIGGGFSRSLFAFALLAAIQGLAQSTGWATLVKTMGAWFGLGERGRVMGWWCTNYTVGAAVAGPFAAWMMTIFGSTAAPYWPAAYWGPAAVVTLVLGLVLVFHKDRPEEVGLPPVDPSPPDERRETLATSDVESPWTVIRQVLAMPAVWVLAASYLAIKLARYAVTSWGVLFVQERLGTSVEASAITSAALPIGGVLGVMASGYASDHLFRCRRAPPAILSLLLCVAVLAVGRFLPAATATPLAMWTFFFVMGFFLYAPDALISASSAIDNGSHRGAATAAGVINGVGSLGAVVGVYLPGVTTTEGDWSMMFNIFIGGLLLSALVLLPLWNHRPGATR